ncbi:MAG: GNAT family N-acetyltransferase [Pseudomonadota bacterium]
MIRQTSADDLAAVDLLLGRAYPRLLKADYPPSVLVMALPIISRAQPQLLRSGTYYVAEHISGQPLGAGGWTPDSRDPKLGHIRHLVTDHRFTRQGVARAILLHVFQTAERAGCTGLTCASTRTAEPFYQALGFETVGPMEVPLAQGIVFPAIRMRRNLP